MPDFHVLYTGDYLDERGKLAVPDIALDLYQNCPIIRQGFLTDQSPQPGDTGYWDRLYSLAQMLTECNAPSPLSWS